MRWLLAGLCLLLGACGKPDNPLLAASDAQFAQLIEPKNAFSASCAAAFYEAELFVKQYNGLKFARAGKIAAVTEEQRRHCADELQVRAAEMGLRAVRPEHLADERIRQRYLAARKG